MSKILDIKNLENRKIITYLIFTQIKLEKEKFPTLKEFLTADWGKMKVFGLTTEWKDGVLRVYKENPEEEAFHYCSVQEKMDLLLNFHKSLTKVETEKFSEILDVLDYDSNPFKFSKEIKKKDTYVLDYIDQINTNEN